MERTIHNVAGERTQYYHRHVSLQLVGAGWALRLAAQPQQPGADEIAATLRLLAWVLPLYPRAFDVVRTDGLYAHPRVLNYVWEPGQDVLAVLKDNHPALLADARSLFETQAAVAGRHGPRTCQWWDLSGFPTWPQVAAPVRMVRSLEPWSVRRPLDGKPEGQHPEWLWVPTLAATRNSRATCSSGLPAGPSRTRTETNWSHAGTLPTSTGLSRRRRWPSA